MKSVPQSYQRMETGPLGAKNLLKVEMKELASMDSLGKWLPVPSVWSWLHLHVSSENVEPNICEERGYFRSDCW